MALDLDQGGRIPQTAKTYLGPSVGWKYTDEPTDIEWVINAGNNVIATGFKGCLLIPSWVVVNSWVLMAGQTGSIVVDIYRVSLAQYLTGLGPQASNSIIGSGTKPTLSNDNCTQGFTISNWAAYSQGAVLINQNDVLGFNVDSCAVIQQVTLSLNCVRIIGIG